MTARQTRPRPGVMALGTAVVLSLALTGCGSGGDAKPSATTTAASSAPAASESPADPHAATKAAVLASYTSMWVEQMKAYRVASPDGTKLDDFATLDALTAFEQDLTHMKKSGTIGTGQLGHEPEVAELDMAAKIPTATVEDCTVICTNSPR